jgi:hypothetical protein
MTRTEKILALIDAESAWATRSQPMTLKARAAAALDQTHFTNLGIQTPSIRAILAAWLDGRKMNTSLVRKSIRYLEMIGASR